MTRSEHDANLGLAEMAQAMVTPEQLKWMEESRLRKQADRDLKAANRYMRASIACAVVAISASLTAFAIPFIHHISPYKPVFDRDHVQIGWCGGVVPPKGVPEDRGEDDEDRPDITWYPTCPKD